MTRTSYWLMVISYLLVVLGLFFYSFTQIDLNLTLFFNPIYQKFQQLMIQLGYFNRPLSTAVFLVLIFLFFIFYFLFLWLVKKNKLSEKQVYLMVGLTVAILIFSYPAFSHDIFNYMFWAKIFTHYGLSPYQYKPLDFPGDSWIRFMHWTHVTYNHGLVFLILSFMPSFLGFGKFVLTLLNFKLLMAASFLGSVFLIGKIMEKINPKSKLLSLAFFSFNPLIIIESLVSGHNDILMLFFTLLSFYLLVVRKFFWSLFSLFISAAIKFLTVSLLPLYVLGIFRKKLNWELLLKLTILFLLGSLIPVIIKREPYPWYFITVLGMASLIIENSFVVFVFSGFSLGLLLRYTPFLYFGDYKPPVPTLTFWLTVLPLGLTFLLWVAQLYYFKVIKKKS